MKENAEKCLSAFKRKSRMYKYDVLVREKLCLSKIWNRGMGLLETIRMYPEKKTVLVNSALWTKRDERVLQSILKELGMEDWDREERFYGYPIFYNSTFGLHLPSNPSKNFLLTGDMAHQYQED